MALAENTRCIWVTAVLPSRDSNFSLCHVVAGRLINKLPDYKTYQILLVWKQSADVNGALLALPRPWACPRNHWGTSCRSAWRASGPCCRGWPRRRQTRSRTRGCSSSIPPPVQSKAKSPSMTRQPWLVRAVIDHWPGREDSIIERGIMIFFFSIDQDWKHLCAEAEIWV